MTGAEHLDSRDVVGEHQHYALEWAWKQGSEEVALTGLRPPLRLGCGFSRGASASGVVSISLSDSCCASFSTDISSMLDDASCFTTTLALTKARVTIYAHIDEVTRSEKGAGHNEWQKLCSGENERCKKPGRLSR